MTHNVNDAARWVERLVEGECDGWVRRMDGHCTRRVLLRPVLIHSDTVGLEFDSRGGHHRSSTAHHTTADRFPLNIAKTSGFRRKVWLVYLNQKRKVSVYCQEGWVCGQNFAGTQDQLLCLVLFFQSLSFLIHGNNLFYME